MSQENVEVMQRAVEAFNRGDYEGYVADLAPGFEYISSGIIPGGDGVYRGREEFLRFVEDLWEGFENTRAEIHEMLEAEDRVLISLTMRARGKQSGAETTWSFFHLWTFRDGKVTRGQGFPDRSEALEAAGVRE